ncbi:MAG: 1-acyl-sn-glycerol-3-phosphate acyltransferase [Clostridia bacterium]|nr:1-acyl-sn-glycerol-3-phosphate acyltransferase [Clostridia bacterium]
MLYVYIVIAAAAVPMLNNFYPVLRQDYSVWLVPLLFSGGVLALIIIHLLIFVIAGLLVSLKKPAGERIPVYRFIVARTLPMLFSLLRVKVESTGLEKVQGLFPAMLVCNHINNIDPAVMIKELPDLKLAFVGKKEIYTEMPFIARYMHKLNCLPIDRENNREAAKTILEAIRLIKEKKVSIGIFPEGYTSLTGELQPFRNGAFKIATKAGCPIIVCTILGTPEAVKHLFVRKNTVYFDVLEVIPASEVTTLTTAGLSERVHSLMSDNITQRRKQICSEK